MIITKMLMAASGSTGYNSTYAIVPTANNIDEGSALTFNVTTTNVSDGTDLYWEASNQGELDDTDGVITINSNAASFTITPTADASSFDDDAETFTVELKTYIQNTPGNVLATSVSVTINNTSVNPRLYKISTIEYPSIGKGPRLHGLEATGLRSVGSGGLGEIIYNPSVMPNNRGFLASASTNSGRQYYQSNFRIFAGTTDGDPDWLQHDQGLFESQQQHVVASQSDIGTHTIYIDSTTILTAKVDSLRNYIKKYTLNTAWDITSINTTPIQTSSFGGKGTSFFSDTLTLLKFNSNGTELIVGTDANGASGGLFKYTLSTGYDLTTMSSTPTQSDTSIDFYGGYITDDGTKVVYCNGLTDWNFRTRTMSTGFDLSTLSTDTVVSHPLGDVHGSSLMVGMAWNEELNGGVFPNGDPAGSYFYLIKGWSTGNTLHIGELSTPYDMSTLTFLDARPGSDPLGIMTGTRQTNQPAYYLNQNTLLMENNLNYTFPSRYLSHFKEFTTGTLLRETWSFSQDDLGNSAMADFGYKENTSYNSWSMNGMTSTTDKKAVTIQTEGTGQSREYHLTYISSEPSSPFALLGGPSTRNITSWVEDNGPAGDATFNRAATDVIDLRYRQDADGNSNIDYKLFVLLRDFSSPEIYWLRQMTSTNSSVENATGGWNLDTGTNAQFVIPRGGTHELPVGDDYQINGFDVSHDGKYILFVTNQRKLHLFENTTPWDLGGTITAIESADIPMIANNKPTSIWYNGYGTKLYVADKTGVLYAYNIALPW